MTRDELVLVLFRFKAYLDPGQWQPRIVLAGAGPEQTEAVQADIKEHWRFVLDFFGFWGEGDEFEDGHFCWVCRATHYVIDRQSINLHCREFECPFFLGGEVRLDRTACRGCKAPVMWAQTVNGKRIPLDVRPTEGGKFIVSPFGVARLHHTWPRRSARYQTHFATCPNADEHRKVPE